MEIENITHPKQLSPLVLAFLGDAVFELMVRTLVVTESNTAPEKLHRRTTRLVKAEAQAIMGHGLWEELSPEEQSVYRRGRNAQSYTHAKNATVSDYRHATGLEALFGYLYLTGQQSRMLQLIALAGAGEDAWAGSRYFFRPAM